MLTRKAQKSRVKKIMRISRDKSYISSLKQGVREHAFALAGEMEHLVSTGLEPELASLHLLKRPCGGDIKTPSPEEMAKYRLMYPSLPKKELVYGIISQEEMRKAAVQKSSSTGALSLLVEQLKIEQATPNTDSLRFELSSLRSTNDDTAIISPAELLPPSLQPVRSGKRRIRSKSRLKRKVEDSSLDTIDPVIKKRGKQYLSKEAGVSEMRKSRKRQLLVEDSSDLTQSKPKRSSL